MSISKAMHQSFADFFAKPSSETLRPLLQLSVGETDNIDYKAEWPEKTKLAKHLLALGNSGGGILIVGVSDDGVKMSIGLTDFKDKTDIGKQVSAYIPKSLMYEVFDFDYGESENSDLKGKKFQVLMVDSSPQNLPYLATKGGDDLKNNAIYVRRSCSSTEASHQDLQKLLDSRIATQDAARRLLDLDEHCEQLKVLYDKVSDGTSTIGFFIGSALAKFMEANTKLSTGQGVKESYQDFVKKCIEKKKARIEKELDI